MRKLVSILSIIAAVSCFCAPRAGASLVFRSGEGWSTEAEGEDAVESSASAQLRKAQGHEYDGDLKKALSDYRGLVRKYPTSGVAAKSQLKVGELYEKLRDYDKAFDAYGKYLSTYPKGEDFDKAVEAQFNIAKLFLEGERKRLFGLKTLPSMERAQQMFESIVKSAPYSKFAPLSQFNIGQALEKQGKKAEAIAAYQVVVVKYPNDSIAVDAQYQIGYVYLKESRAAYDPAARTKAREAFEDFIARNPKSEKVSQAQDDIKSLSGNDTKGVLDVAKFYDKQKNYKAAVIYYNEVIKQQPGTPESDTAKARIEELKTLVGEDALRPGPERTETGERAQLKRKLNAQVDTASRPDYLGPPVSAPEEQPPAKPKMRAAPDQSGPVPAVEPTLPQ